MTTLEKIIEQIKNGQAENITEINLSFNQIGDEGAAAFAEALKGVNLPHLKYIELSRSLIGSQGAASIAEAFKEANLPHLEYINLCHNKIGDEGAAAFAEALKGVNLPHLEYIELSRSLIGSQGAASIAEALKEANLPHLRMIHLSKNQIGSQGAVALSKALKEANLPHLNWIELGDNQIGDGGAKAITEILETCIISNKKYLAKATEKAKQKLQLDWDSTAYKIKRALIDIEYAKLLKEEDKLKVAIDLYGAALHGFRHLIGEVPKSLDIKQIIKQATEGMKIAIKEHKEKIGNLKLPVFVLLECFEHLNAKAFEQDLLKLFVDRGIKKLWDQNLAGIIFDMMPSKGQPALFLDIFRKLAAASSEEDSKDDDDIISSKLIGDAGTASQSEG